MADWDARRQRRSAGARCGARDRIRMSRTADVPAAIPEVEEREDTDALVAPPGSPSCTTHLDCCRINNFARLTWPDAASRGHRRNHGATVTETTARSLLCRPRATPSRCPARATSPSHHRHLREVLAPCSVHPGGS